MPKVYPECNARNIHALTGRPGTRTDGPDSAPSAGLEPASALGLSSSGRNLSAPFKGALIARHYADGQAVVYRSPEPETPQEAAYRAVRRPEKAAQLRAAQEAYLARTGGVRRQAGLTNKAARKIKRAVRLIAYERKYNAFVTLSFGRWVPDHKTAKRLLSMFFRRMERKYGKVPYVWVAELQERGAIHFHIYVGRWIDRAWLNAAWNEVVNDEALRRGQEPQALLPNVRGGKAMKGKYMSKTVGLYMAKVEATKARMKGEDISAREIQGNTYGMDTQARALVKGQQLEFAFPDPQALETAFLEAVDAAEGKVIACGSSFTLGCTWSAPVMLEALSAYSTGPPGQVAA